MKEVKRTGLAPSHLVCPPGPSQLYLIFEPKYAITYRSVGRPIRVPSSSSADLSYEPRVARPVYFLALLPSRCLFIRNQSKIERGWYELSL